MYTSLWTFALHDLLTSHEAAERMVPARDTWRPEVIEGQVMYFLVKYITCPSIGLIRIGDNNAG